MIPLIRIIDIEVKSSKNASFRYDFAAQRIRRLRLILVFTSIRESRLAFCSLPSRWIISSIILRHTALEKHCLRAFVSASLATSFARKRDYSAIFMQMFQIIFDE
jgi:hypothetical protein